MTHQQLNFCPPRELEKPINLAKISSNLQVLTLQIFTHRTL